MKKISKIVISLIIMLGFATSVNALSYSSSITTQKSGTTYEYIDGLSINFNKSGSYNLYVLNKDTYYDSKVTLTDPIEADKGFAYIINNNNVTSNSNKNYYIAQVAILWYQDYLNGNDANISASLKTYITNNTTDTVCFYINKLVTNAKALNDNKDSIVFDTKNITFYESGSYYYSNYINITTNGLNSTPSVKLYNAPKNATIINNSLSNDGKGSFQIRIPSSSIDYSDDFEVYITGTKTDYTVYKYSFYGGEDAIYGRVYTSSSNNIEASMPVTIKESTYQKVRIKVVDDDNNYLSGVKINIYKGNCLNDSCSTDNLLKSFTTTNTYRDYNDLFETGIYTLTFSSSNYNLPTKKAYNIKESENIQTITVQGEEIKYNTTLASKYFTIYNDYNDKDNYIKIYTTSGVLKKSYESTETSYSLTLTEGNYYIIDSKYNFDKLYFQITSDGILKVKYNSTYVTVDDIYLNIEEFPTTNNDNVNNLNDDNSNIEIKNEVITTTTIETSFISNLIDCPKTALFSTFKYILGAIVLSIGGCLVYKNVKKSKNNN